MPLPHTIHPNTFHSRHKRRSVPTAPTPPAPLTLVAASFDPDGPEVYLTFDRAVDVSGIVVAQFVVDDGPDGHHLVGFLEPTIVSPTEVSVLMFITDSAGGPDVTLNVGSSNGIVAQDDGGTWAGVSSLVLPFGE